MSGEPSTETLRAADPAHRLALAAYFGSGTNCPGNGLANRVALITPTAHARPHITPPAAKVIQRRVISSRHPGDAPPMNAAQRPPGLA